MLKRKKMVLLQKHKKKNTDTQSVKNVKNNNRFLITINVNGSAGPIRFVANEDDLVAGVIGTTLKAYARLSRLPLLGSDVNNFLLYQANAVFQALDPCERIGSHGGRNFVLYKKSQP